MSADTVIDALQSWLQPPAVIGLNTVYDAAPWMDAAPNWDLTSQLGWGAVGFLHIEHEVESRIAMGGSRGGLKRVVYDVGLAVQFQWLIEQDALAGPAPTGYRRPLNQLLDGVKRRLREDRIIGTGDLPDGDGGVIATPDGTILQVGEGDFGSGDDITISRDLPKRDRGKVWSWNLIEFKVVEVLVS